MFEHFDDLSDLFTYRLGMALSMERDSLDMLGKLRDASSKEEIRHLFEHHAQETRGQIEKLEQVFTILGIEDDKEPSPTTKGLAKEGESLLRKSDDALHDNVAVSAGLGTEHFEISAYQTLIATADALGAKKVVALLQQNLDQEVHASHDLKKAAEELAMVGPGGVGVGAWGSEPDSGTT